MLLANNVAEQEWSMHHSCCINRSETGTDESSDKTSLLKWVVSPVCFSCISFVILFVVLVPLLGLQLLRAPPLPHHSSKRAVAHPSVENASWLSHPCHEHDIYANRLAKITAIDRAYSQPNRMRGSRAIPVARICRDLHPQK
jgi:hypothetical protein